MQLQRRLLCHLYFFKRLANRKASVPRKKSGSSIIDTPCETTQLANAVINFPCGDKYISTLKPIPAVSIEVIEHHSNNEQILVKITGEHS